MVQIDDNYKKPIKRSRLRAKCGMAYYGFKRKQMWKKMNNIFAQERIEKTLEYQYFEHKTLLLRKLKDVDMQLQYNKIENLKIATKKLNKIVIHPGEVFSYWKLIGKPLKKDGYKKGMVLNNGTFHAETGGGLCQLSNLIFWMAIHTPLTVIERHRHGYDVFPDSNRTQPFGSGATCYYPHGDLMIENNTNDDYQLILNVGEEYLEGKILCSNKPKYRYEIEERNHEMKTEYWGGYTRNNELYQLKYDLNNNLLDENLIVKNKAIMMYQPYLEYEKNSED